FRNSPSTELLMRTEAKSRPPQAGQSAFTLIELLVVIAIIAILAAMLLPVLAASKDKALRTQCINDMKQLALCMGMYSMDNNEWMAFPGWDGGNKGPQGWLYDATSG